MKNRNKKNGVENNRNGQVFQFKESSDKLTQPSRDLPCSQDYKKEISTFNSADHSSDRSLSSSQPEFEMVEEPIFDKKTLFLGLILILTFIFFGLFFGGESSFFNKLNFLSKENALNEEPSAEPSLALESSISSKVPTSREEKEITSLRNQSSETSTTLSKKQNSIPDLDSLSVSYNVTDFPPFRETTKESQYLSDLIHDILKLIQSKGLPNSSLSISLVNLRSEECCPYVGHQDSEVRFPASIAKLFWIVMLYGHYEDGSLIRGNPITLSDEHRAIHDSDNEAASKIVDAVTNTNSFKSELPDDELDDWISARQDINHYFNHAGYEKINLTQKTFPIPYLDMYEPEGSELQIRNVPLQEDSTTLPVRNYITTRSVARLLYEVETGQAVSNDFSYDLKQLMLHDHGRLDWEDVPYNSIEGFFGQVFTKETFD
jgi:hypothetical protein